ncbi:MAG: DUF4388 domain-containing protein [Nitrospirota bacterium]|nr:DUF4388 domain-containing protein [Nitrospirota bacterium]
MGLIKGDLSVMSLADILQWVDASKKTGTLQVYNQGDEKKIYVETGKIVFISSNKEGERLGEYLTRNSHLETTKIKSALLQSQTMKVPFTQRLIDLKYFTAEQLQDIITKQAGTILLDAIDWTNGTFEFLQDELPTNVLRGPISLNTSELLHDVFRRRED